MAKKRTIPFGYRMENGKITAHPGEVLAVLSVFSDYLAGKSMNQIAAQMDVPYDDGVRWNKNKIHRILGNKTYLGTDKYPQLISEEVFQAVQEAKPARAKAIRLIPEDMQEIADMVFCKECGHGQPEIVPEDADTVREIFRLFLDGYSIRDITRNMIQQERRNALGTTDWNTNTIRRILTNEKYTGDALLQKTYTTDCITHRSVKNNGERTMYLVTDCHPAIIDRDTYHLAQQELARRTSKRKVSTKSVTEQGKYSSKFALTELMICGECGTPYRRCTWNVHGKKRIVWRCLNRLEHGSKAQCQISAEEQRQLETTLEDVENARFELDCFDNVLVRKLIKCVRVLSKEKIQMIFKSGYEVTAEMEK